MDWIVLRVEMWLTILGDEWNVDDKVVGWKVCGWLLMDCVSSYCVVCVSIHQDAACVWRGVPAGADWHRRSRWTVDCLAVSQHEPGRICPRLLRHFREEVLTTLQRTNSLYIVTVWILFGVIPPCDHTVQQKLEMGTWQDRSVSRLPACWSRPDRNILWSRILWRKTSEIAFGTLCLLLEQKCWSTQLLCYQWVIWIISNVYKFLSIACRTTVYLSICWVFSFFSVKHFHLRWWHHQRTCETTKQSLAAAEMVNSGSEWIWI